MSTAEASGVPEWDLADRLRKALRVGKVSVTTMATHLELDRRTITNYLSSRTAPSTAVVRVWAIRCGVPFAWLKYGVAEPDDPTAQVITTPRCIELSARRRPYLHPVPAAA